MFVPSTVCEFNRSSARAHGRRRWAPSLTLSHEATKLSIPDPSRRKSFEQCLIRTSSLSEEICDPL